MTSGSRLYFPENGNKNRTRGILLTLLGGIFWGFSGTCGQFLFTRTDVSVNMVSAVRMFFGGAVLLAVCFARDRERTLAIWKDRASVLRLLLFSLCGLMICQYTYLTAISYSNAGTATVLQYLAPAMILVVLCIRKRALPRRAEVLALILALSGVFLLATHGNPGNLVLSKQALAWGLASAVGMMLYSLLPGSLVREWGSMIVTAYGMLITGMVIGVITKVWREPFTPNGNAFLGLTAITLFGTVFAYTMYMQGVADIGAGKASLLACIEPVAATVFAAVWMGTQFLPVDFLGFAAILLSAAILSLKE